MNGRVWPLHRVQEGEVQVWEKRKKAVKSAVKSALSLEGSREPWKVTGSDIFLSGFPGGTNNKETSCQCRRHKRCRFHPWIGTIAWRREGQSTPVFLPGESHEQRSLVGYSP